MDQMSDRDNSLPCPYCGDDSGVAADYGLLGSSDLHCRSCRARVILDYDETWDGEEEMQIFRLERTPDSAKSISVTLPQTHTD